jgi:hypothetical protein
MDNQVKKPTCWDCKNGHKVKGFPDTRDEPGEPDYVYCEYGEESRWPSEILLMDEERFSQDATECPEYEPEPAGPCALCRDEIKAPRFYWPFWVSGEFDSYPCCTQGHADQWNANEARRRERERADLERYYAELERHHQERGV